MASFLEVLLVYLSVYKYGRIAEERAQKFHHQLMIYHYADLSSASDWLKKISHAAQLIRSTSQIISMVFQPGLQVLSGMVFLSLSFRRHFAGNQVVESRNVGMLISYFFFVETNLRGCQLNTVFIVRNWSCPPLTRAFTV